MKVLRSSLVREEGNDCYIETAVDIIEVFGNLYLIVQVVRVIGWANEITTRTETTTDYSVAMEIYKNFGGKV